MTTALKKRPPCAACGAPKSCDQSTFLVDRRSCSGEFWICLACWSDGVNDEAWNERVTQRIMQRRNLARLSLAHVGS